MLDLVFQNSTSDKFPKKDFFEKIISIGAGKLNMKVKHVGISLNLVEDGRIKELNKKYRRKNKVTDVLSFPMTDAPSKKLRVTSYELPVTDLGDIFICLPFAKKQAKSENVSIDRKLAQLTVHGFLHLAGYDHEVSRQEAGKMLNLENKILNKLYDW